MKSLIRGPLVTAAATLLGALLVFQNAAGDRSPRPPSTKELNIPRLMLGGPPPAELVGPSPAITLTTPNVRFQWRAGAGLTGAARYEICVRRVDRPCTDPEALVIRPTGTLLTESPIPEIRIDQFGNRTYDQAAGTGDGATPPFYFQATLPIQMQGRRLNWSITTCVPSNQAEACTESVLRPFTYPLPFPVPQAPTDNTVLTAPLRPTFTWSVANPQGVESYLLCLAFAGVVCPTAPTAQPNVVVGPVTGTTQMQPQQGFFSSLMGKSLQWRVAACNAELGCTPYTTARSFKVPILDGTFDAIYAVTQNEKCTNCHHMHNRNAVYQRHIALGRFPDNEDTNVALEPWVTLPKTDGEKFLGLQAKSKAVCGECHTAALGFADGWRAPHDVDFNEPISAPFCQRLVAPRYNFGFEGEDESGFLHLRNDGLVSWAVSRIPGLGVARWQQNIDAWRGAGAPCPPAWQGQFPTH